MGGREDEKAWVSAACSVTKEAAPTELSQLATVSVGLLCVQGSFRLALMKESIPELAGVKLSVGICIQIDAELVPVTQRCESVERAARHCTGA